MAFDLTPAAEYDLMCIQADAMQEQAQRHAICRDCDDCHIVPVPGTSIKVGWCSYQDLPLTPSDLESTVWDMGCDKMQPI